MREGRKVAISQVVIEGNEKIVSHHDIPEPTDVMLGQYSTAFCAALVGAFAPAEVIEGRSGSRIEVRDRPAASPQFNRLMVLNRSTARASMV